MKNLFLAAFATIILFALVSIVVPGVAEGTEACAPADFVCEARQLRAEAGERELTAGQAGQAARAVDETASVLKARVAELERRAAVDAATQRALVEEVSNLRGRVVALERLAAGLRFAAAGGRARSGSDAGSCGISPKKLSARISEIRQLRAAVRELSRQGQLTAADATYAKVGVVEHEKRIRALEAWISELDRQVLKTAADARRASVGVDELHRRLTYTEAVLGRWGFAPQQSQKVSAEVGISGFGKDAAIMGGLSLRGLVNNQAGGLVRGRFIGGLGDSRGRGADLLFGGWYSPYGESYLWAGIGGALETFAAKWRAELSGGAGWSYHFFGPLSLEVEGTVARGDKWIVRGTIGAGIHF